LRPGEEVILEGSTNGKPILASYWTPFDSSLCADCLVYTFHPQSSGWVKLQVEDEIGCPGEDSIWVQVTPAVYSPNVIHPGSVLGNESFTLYSEYPLLIKHLNIYSRWGELVFQQKDFLTNDNSHGWNAEFHGKELPAGVYTFEARIEVEAGRFEDIRGDISVLR
jgi:gliding motility-associated-like protein